MIFTKWFTGFGPRQILCMLLALAVLGTAAGALPPASVPPTEPYFAGSGTSSDGEDVSIGEVWLQGFDDGFLDGASFWRGYSLEKRLKEHHYNTEQILAYTDGYNLGYKLGKARWGVSTSQSLRASA